MKCMEQRNQMSKSSNEVYKPVEELIKYASSLELLIQTMTFEDGSPFHNYQLDILRNTFCPHWDDIINEMKNSGSDYE